MEEKVLNLIEKMYGEMQQGFRQVNDEMQQGFQKVSDDITRLDKEVTGLRYDITRLDKEATRLRHDIVRMENKMDGNDKALYDGYKQNIEINTHISKKLDRLIEKVDSQEIRLKVLKSVN